MSVRRLPTRLRSWANARTAAGTLLGGFLLLVMFAFWLSPWMESHMNGQGLLDTDPWRTPAEVDASLLAYGDAGRAFYRRVLMIDLLFPLVYVLPMALSVAFAALQIHRLRRYAHVAVLLPIAGGLFDWGENASLLVQVSQLPDHANLVSWVAWSMTLLKSVMLVAAVSIIIWGLGVYYRRRRKMSTSTEATS